LPEPRYEESELIELPLVSVVIINYNYGRFLRQAVDSVIDQTYPNVECIVVDNASTDESGVVIAALEAENASLKTVYRASNDGQTPASLDGLAASAGQYVIFLDADDALLPHCIETHVFAHLSLRIHVGFTSGDMLQVCGDQVVVSTGEAMNRFIRRRKPSRKLFRAYRHPTGMAWPSAQCPDMAEKIYFVPPLWNKWVWAPTSGLCYRRDALLLFSDNEGLAHLRTGTDMYFAHGIGALCGSVLIDEPLFVYRFHGGNIYSQRAQLNRTLCYTPGGQGDSNDHARMVLIDQFFTHIDRFTQTIGLKLNFVALLFRLDFKDLDHPRPHRSRVATNLVAHFDSVAAVLGRAPTRLLMICFRAPLRHVWSAGRKPVIW
jgi:glycosyltransferase involved in cell wall biosynthesis